MQPKFEPTGVRTHDLQIKTVQFMSLRRLLYTRDGVTFSTCLHSKFHNSLQRMELTILAVKSSKARQADTLAGHGVTASSVFTFAHLENTKTH